MNAQAAGTASSTAAGTALPAVAEVDLAAVRANVAALSAAAGPAEVMAVVKADAYGHGLVPCAQAALAGGATWLGVAQLAEGLALRRAGVGGRLLSWLHVPGDDFADALGADIELSVSARWALEEIRAAATTTGRTARIQLKADTGLSRNGCQPRDWPDLVASVGAAVAEGSVEVTGVWSHLAWADAPSHPTVRRQRELFVEMAAQVERAGIPVPLRHLANSAATLTDPNARFDIVRPGLAVYGLSPVPDLGGPAAYGLTPAMTVRGRLASVKQVPAGEGVSYGHDYHTGQDTVLALVPLGYADGVPRSAGNRGPVLAAGRRRTIAGRVCMDQFVLDLGGGPDAADAAAGDEVVLFGPGRDGEPTAQDWADAAGTISYEIVARLGVRVPRRYVGSDA
ncbi:MAG: alanine racemase [Actinomycetales bacterium]